MGIIGFILKQDLVYSIAAIASCGATEPKDKVFAIHGLLTKLGIKLPLPNYSAPLADVY
jgi:hypothetical protein